MPIFFQASARHSCAHRNWARSRGSCPRHQQPAVIICQMPLNLKVLPDQALLDLLRQERDTEAIFEEFRQRYHAALWRFLKHLDPKNYEDLEQEVWIKFLLNAPPDAKSLLGWLYTVGRNLFVTAKRLRGADVVTEADLPTNRTPGVYDSPSNQEDSVLDSLVEAVRVRDAQQEIAECVAALSEEDQIIIYNCVEGSVEAGEMSRLLSIALGTFYTRKSRALARLREGLAKRGLMSAEEYGQRRIELARAREEVQTKSHRIRTALAQLDSRPERIAVLEILFKNLSLLDMLEFLRIAWGDASTENRRRINNFLGELTRRHVIEPQEQQYPQLLERRAGKRLPTPTELTVLVEVLEALDNKTRASIIEFVFEDRLANGGLLAALDAARNELCNDRLSAICRYLDLLVQNCAITAHEIGLIRTMLPSWVPPPIPKKIKKTAHPGGAHDPDAESETQK